MIQYFTKIKKREVIVFTWFPYTTCIKYVEFYLRFYREIAQLFDYHYCLEIMAYLKLKRFKKDSTFSVKDYHSQENLNCTLCNIRLVDKQSSWFYEVRIAGRVG